MLRDALCSSLIALSSLVTTEFDDKSKVVEAKENLTCRGLNHLFYSLLRHYQ